MAKKKGPNPGLLFIIAGAFFLIMGMMFRPGQEERYDVYHSHMRMVESGEAPVVALTVEAKREWQSSNGQSARTEYAMVFKTPSGEVLEKGVPGDLYKNVQVGETVNGYDVGSRIFLPRADYPGNPKKTFKTVQYIAYFFLLLGAVVFLVKRRSASR